jgi:phosphoglucosamine mutase
MFGTDGVRGIAGSELTGAFAYRLGRATVAALGDERGPSPSIVVGRDTRASGEFLEAAVVAGICSAGGDALVLGVCTTPGVAHLTADLGAGAGVVISASHNPALYNGIKLFDGRGQKLPDALEDRIEAIATSNDVPDAAGRSIGRVRPVTDAHDRYLRHVLASAPPGALAGMRLVVDCANGAACGVGPAALERLGADVVAINDRPDGWNINEGAGATEPKVVARAVAEHAADAGVTFDGDADRALFAGADGTVIDGDQVLAACAVDLKSRGLLTGERVVTTVMANLGFRSAMRAAGIEVLETRVGDRYVLEEMLASGAVLGGEQSGHVIFLDQATTGDGLVTAVQFLTLSTRTGRSVADLGAVMTRHPQVLRNVDVSDRGGLDDAAAVWEAVRSAERELGEGGRVLVRASGTEPLVRVMVEAVHEADAERHADHVAGVVRSELS